MNDSEYNAGPNITTLIEPTPLTAGVSELGENRVSSLTVVSPAQVLVSFEEALIEESESEEPNESTVTLPFVAAQKVGTGTFVMSGDSNMFSDNSEGFYSLASNGTFARDLCP